MLSRTASDLYWMSRYLERAENLARMLEVSYSLSLMPQAGRGDGHAELAMSLLAAGTLDDYNARYDALNSEHMLHFFALDETNPGSIYSCLRAARTNAHAVRGRITADMWENINATWLEMRNIASNGLGRYGISHFCEWVKERSHLFRGATSGTIMRNDAYSFIRLGTFIERADNTLRLLDARYEMFGEESEEVSDNSARGYYQWSALLRALSSFEAFNEIYRNAPNAEQVSEMLLLRADVPRSVAGLHRGTGPDPRQPAGPQRPASPASGGGVACAPALFGNRRDPRIGPASMADRPYWPGAPPGPDRS
ncbi:hypothetical protein PHLH5_24280 [Pseudomonas sp. Cab53]|nr:hypothetical protein PHLH5_24280 [Pseudomonas sp. Cab53]